MNHLTGSSRDYKRFPTCLLISTHTWHLSMMDRSSIVRAYHNSFFYNCRWKIVSNFESIRLSIHIYCKLFFFAWSILQYCPNSAHFSIHCYPRQFLELGSPSVIDIAFSLSRIFYVLIGSQYFFSSVLFLLFLIKFSDNCTGNYESVIITYNFIVWIICIYVCS